MLYLLVTYQARYHGGTKAHQGLKNRPLTSKATTSIGDALHSLDLSDDQLQARWSVSNFGGAVGTLVVVTLPHPPIGTGLTYQAITTKAMT